MLSLMLAINLFVNPEVPHVETLQRVVYAIPVEPPPAEIDRRCTRAETNACDATCARSALSSWCNVRTDSRTGMLTRFCYCYDISLQVQEAVPDPMTCQR